MLSYITKYRVLRGDTFYQQIEGECLSTDQKPDVHILNGSSLVEMDTGKVYFFDETGGQWIPFKEG